MWSHIRTKELLWRLGSPPKAIPHPLAASHSIDIPPAAPGWAVQGFSMRKMAFLRHQHSQGEARMPVLEDPF